MFWLWNKDQGHWPSLGAKLWPFKGAKTGVFGFSWGVTYSEYLSCHVANTISSLTPNIIINHYPPPVLGHHPFLVIVHVQIIHLSISPDEVCPGVAGVMDHHQLLAQAAVTATAADGVIVQEDHGEQDTQDIQGPTDYEDC